MGLLYNKFTNSLPPATNAWQLINTFTELSPDTLTPVQEIDIVGKTEMLIVCNGIISMVFPLRNIAPSAYSQYYAEQQTVEKIYNTNTGTGYRFNVRFIPNYNNTAKSNLAVTGQQWTGVSTYTALSSATIKVYMR